MVLAGVAETVGQRTSPRHRPQLVASAALVAANHVGAHRSWVRAASQSTTTAVGDLSHCVEVVEQGFDVAPVGHIVCLTRQAVIVAVRRDRRTDP